jgi:DNA-binding XRE family transcriptional regulator
MEQLHPLKAWRQSFNPPKTQKSAAEEVGVDRVTWARWETDPERKIDTDKLPTVSAKTGIPPGKLRPDLAELLKDGGG